MASAQGHLFECSMLSLSGPGGLRGEIYMYRFVSWETLSDGCFQNDTKETIQENECGRCRPGIGKLRPWGHMWPIKP